MVVRALLSAHTHTFQYRSSRRVRQGCPNASLSCVVIIISGNHLLIRKNLVQDGFKNSKKGCTAFNKVVQPFFIFISIYKWE